MRTLYLDCGMGAAGDMLTAALLELLPEPDEFVKELNALGIPGVQFKKELSIKCGITGTHMAVTIDGEEEGSHDHERSCDHEHSHDHEHKHSHGHNEHDHSHGHDEHDHSHGHDEHDHSHGHDEHDHSHSHHDHNHSHNYHHSSLYDIEHIIREDLSLTEKVQNDVIAVYELIAEAKSHVHGVPVKEIHFHEVGTMDAIADITAVCMLINRLSPDEVVVSPVHVGSGQVKCAHGILPVPAPATVYILKDVPIYGGSIRGELCTPTGAALLKHFATRFDSMPVMKTQAIGYGMGKKDFEEVNCVRAMLGETDHIGDEIYELSCNVDDMTGEEIGFATERLFAAGALDVYTIPIGMKKNRPGILIHIMCRKTDKETMIQAVFKYTTTIGIRESSLNRYVLDRHIETLETPYGAVRCKVSSGYGVKRRKYEYDDLSRIAREKGISISKAAYLVDDNDLRREREGFV